VGCHHKDHVQLHVYRAVSGTAVLKASGVRVEKWAAEVIFFRHSDRETLPKSDKPARAVFAERGPEAFANCLGDTDMSFGESTCRANHGATT
jgi:hypothetical protein